MHIETRDPSTSLHWREAPTQDLIDFVVARFHARHRAQLPDLIRLSRRVELVHVDKQDCPVGLSEVMEALYQELESHMMKEERVLFPMLAQGMRSQARAPISVMRYEHSQHLEALETIRHLTADLVAPAHACDTWRALYEEIRRFIDDLTQHVQFENDMLFSLDSNAAEGAHDA